MWMSFIIEGGFFSQTCKVRSKPRSLKRPKLSNRTAGGVRLVHFVCSKVFC